MLLFIAFPVKSEVAFNPPDPVNVIEDNQIVDQSFSVDFDFQMSFEINQMHDFQLNDFSDYQITTQTAVSDFDELSGMIISQIADAVNINQLKQTKSDNPYRNPRDGIRC